LSNGRRAPGSVDPNSPSPGRAADREKQMPAN
jgi:hypothetical protein